MTLNARTLRQLVSCALLYSVALLPSAIASESGITSKALTKSSRWFYDWGLYGAFPRRTYESFGAESPWPALVETSEQCDGGYAFIGPRGHYVSTPGPVMLDNTGELVWMDTRFGQAMDVRVQRYRGNDYITFWEGFDTLTSGQGYYLMIDETYQVFKNITPVGFLGDLHEFRITDDDTALMSIYSRQRADLSSVGVAEGWIHESSFQEIDLATGELLFEWHASDHFGITDGPAPYAGEGKDEASAWDYFHINSVDKDADGNYLISSRYMCTVAAISSQDGHVMWQLGGRNNYFQDLSAGAATNFTWNHHASWVDNTTLTLFDNGANYNHAGLTIAEYSRGLMIDLDMEAMTARLIQDYVSPARFLSGSQGSVQALSNGNVLVSWGHIPAFTEFSQDGKVLCETHIGPVNMDTFAWVKNYRTFKHHWVGRPETLPTVAARPSENALYVSWNGATEVTRWMLQSSPDQSNNTFVDHEVLEKTTFETRFELDDRVNTYVRIVALDKDNHILATSESVSKLEYTVVELLPAPSRSSPIEPLHIFLFSLACAFTLCCIMYRSRASLRRVARIVLRRKDSIKYVLLPQ